VRRGPTAAPTGRGEARRWHRPGSARSASPPGEGLHQHRFRRRRRSRVEARSAQTRRARAPGSSIGCGTRLSFVSHVAADAWTCEPSSPFGDPNAFPSGEADASLRRSPPSMAAGRKSFNLRKRYFASSTMRGRSRKWALCLFTAPSRLRPRRSSHCRSTWARAGRPRGDMFERVDETFTLENPDSDRRVV
jgi:hypothetical protein